MKVALLGDARSIHVRRLARGLAARSHDVHVITHKPAAIEGVRVERFSIPGPGLRNPRRWASRKRRHVRDILRRFDVVNVHFLADWGLTPELMREGCVIATAWGSDVVHPPGEIPPDEQTVAARKTLLREADAVTACGPTFARRVAAWGGIDPARVEVVPFGVDVERFRPVPSQHASFSCSKPRTFARATDRDALPRRRERRRSAIPANVPDETEVSGRSSSPERRSDDMVSPWIEGSGDEAPVVGFYKGFREVYGASYLVRAIPKVAARVPGVGFELIGDGPEREPCRRLTEVLGVADRAMFLPARPHGRLPRYLRRWAVSVIPSVCEAFGVAALESQAMEVPVVASRVGGLLDTVRDGETGLLVEPCSADALAEGIVKLLTDSALRRAMGRAGRRFVCERFEQQKTLDQWEAFYERVRERSCVMV
ncbi:MAG: glycosyltransferase family 4 protein [Planctomycetota bacterium]|nr:MAG: glycosyltransferase family 4 protein [Planctomycetota bacterium]